MSSSEKNENRKITRFPPEPLCLFCFPEEVSLNTPIKKTYVNAIPSREPEIKTVRRKFRKEGEHRKANEDKSREKNEIWLKKRNEARIIRRRMKEPMKNLKSILLTSVNHGENEEKTVIPSLYEVLETVKDAWPPPQRKEISLEKQEDQKPLDSNNMILSKTKMKEEIYLQFPSPLINRRFSMPEELMRKYSILKEKTSDESETYKTVNEMTSSTSSTIEESVVRKPSKPQNAIGKSDSLSSIKMATFQEDRSPKVIRKTVKESKTVLTTPKRVTQSDYYSQGKSIIKFKKTDNMSTIKVCMCMSEKASSTTPSVKEETDESVTSESIASSSPVQLPKQEFSSDNLSSESDYIVCTCREITSSKETSTDIFFSGKSTLSQTVSDKSISTQDSTVSVKSVSTRGSTPSDNSVTTTSEVERISAKDSTTSDYSPRTPRNGMNRKNRRKEKYYRSEHKKFCPKFHENLPPSNNHRDASNLTNPKQQKDEIEKSRFCNVSSEVTQTETAKKINGLKKEVEILSEAQQVEDGEESGNIEYTWAKLNQDELNMMQHLRHQKLMEKGFTIPIDYKQECCEFSDVPSNDETENLNDSIMIPRYSALPRTLSMLVNTSSADNSIHNSDSDNQSLADSLEDQPTTHVHKLYFDTKKESKPVRGDLPVVKGSKERRRVPKGKAFFVSIRSPYGEVEMLEGINRIPQPPEKIKNQIFERHLRIYTKHKQQRENKQEPKKIYKKRSTRSVRSEEPEKTSRNRKGRVKSQKENENKQISQREQTDMKKKDVEEENVKKMEEDKGKKKQKDLKQSQNIKSRVKRKKEPKEQKGPYISKIPILVNNRLISSPERDFDIETTFRKTGEREERAREVETTQILEITQTDKDIILKKPPTINFSNQNRPENVRIEEKERIIMPSLTINTRTQQQPFRQTINRSIFLTQTRKSPVSKFRQRFEVIPEEKSSSLSSTEEKTSMEPLPKFTNTATSPLPMKEDQVDKVQFQNYNITEVPNLFMAQIRDKQLQTLPYLPKGVNDPNIILFASKSQNSNSSKGRDALIAMDRGDFSRLAKGWMNFYKLKDNSENSDTESKVGKKKKRSLKNSTKELGKDEKATDYNEAASKTDSGINSQSENENKIVGNSDSVKEGGKQNMQVTTSSQNVVKNTSENSTKKNHESEIDENIRFHSSNTILQTVKTISPRFIPSRAQPKRQSSLPDLKVPTPTNNDDIMKQISSVDTLPQVIAYEINSEDDSDSDSTDYMEPPTPRVPPLSFEDFPSDDTLSSSESEFDEPSLQVTNNVIKPYQIKKRSTINKSNLFETTRIGKKKNSGWSVTVAGTVELSRSTPDLQMRLSFPMDEETTTMGQNDSNFTGNTKYYKIPESVLESSNTSTAKGLSLPSSEMKQKWTVTVGNPKQGSVQNLRQPKTLKHLNHMLPNLEPLQNRSTKKVLKKIALGKSQKEMVSRKLYAIWPKVQKIIQKEFYTDDEKLINVFSEEIDEDSFLFVKGAAVLLEKKKKPLTMTERDITRRDTARKSI